MASSLSKLGKLFSLQSGKTPNGVIGIDFGSSSIKVVELAQKDGSVTLQTYGELQLGPYASLEVGRATNLGATMLTKALKDIIEEASVTSNLAGVAVPYASSFVVVIPVPTSNPNDLVAMIPIEARKYVPVPIAQVTLDWFVIPEKKGAESTSRGPRVLLAAIHNEALSKFKSAIEYAGVKSSFNEIEIFSTIRSSVLNQTDTVMIIDIGAASTKLYVVSDGIVQATHSINAGGQDFTSSLSKSLELSINDAEELKRDVGLTAVDNPRIERALSFPLERIFIETRRVLEVYERGEGVAGVSAVILSGGGATMKGMEMYVERILGRSVVRANPFAKVAYPAFLEGTLREIGPSFAVAIGVALRRLQE